ARDVLRHRLVQRQRANERIRERVRHAVRIEERRNLRLAAEAFDALRDVEHEVPALAGDEPLGERAHVTDSDAFVAERRERGGDRVDRLDRVELRDVGFGEAALEVVVLQVVRQADQHACGNVAPSVPSGSGYRHVSPLKLRSSRSLPSRPITASGNSAILPPPAGASTTYVGTAYPVVNPRKPRISSMPRSTLVLKWLEPRIGSH